MSHLIEEYAKNLGVKIGKPVVAQHFFPIVPERYVTISADADHISKKYNHYSIVLDCIRSSLDRLNIKVVQVGSSASGLIRGVDEAFFDLSFKQTTYILSKSLLHIGVDNIFSHYVSSIEIPLVTIFGNTFAKCGQGYWSNPNNRINIEAPWQNKPPFGAVQSDEIINKIKPETIAQAILDQIGANQFLSLKTLFIGNYYHNEVNELIPDFLNHSEHLKRKHWFIRLDLCGEENYFRDWCAFLPTFSVFSRKMIGVEFLKEISGRCETLLLILERGVEVPVEYITTVQSLNINVSLLVENDEDLPHFRNKYFDFAVQPLYPADFSELNSLDISYGQSLFNSSKIIVSRGQKYPSIYHWKKNQNLLDKNFVIEDNPELLREFNHFYIYDT
jgi:hypothetical protein